MKKLLLSLTIMLCMASSVKALTQVGGVYQIGNAADLKAFADLVNGGTTGANAVLTTDIDYTAYTTGYIGTDSRRYSGTFDGKGYTITTNIKTDVRGTGLFGSISGATIKNLVLEGNIESSRQWIGGIGGIARGDATNIQNVIVKSTLKFTGSGDSTCGGLFGDMEGAFTVRNCAFLGTIDVGSGTNVAGLASWTGSGSFTNCLVAPVSVTSEDTQEFSYKWGGGASCNNCYIVANNDAKLASGQLCYQLNGSKSGGTDWYQTLGTNSYPVPFNTSKRIYKNQSNAYVNVDSPVQIGNATDLANFAAIVNDGGVDLAAELTADIDYRSYTGVANMIGDNNNVRYAGTFDGQGHTVTVAFSTTSVQETGLFRRINGATIQNLKVAGTITASDKFAGGIVARVNGGTGTIRNCESAVTINDSGSGDATHGGILGVGSGTVQVTNCLFSGSINASSRTGCSGIVGWGEANVAVTNCLVIGEITLASGDNDIISRGSTTGSGNYYCDTYSLNNRLTASSATATQKTSGELCYLLNGSVADGTTWTQTIGTDANPIPFSASQTVHQASPSGYTNLPVSDGDGYVLIGSPANLQKFAAEVNAGNQNLNAKLSADINMLGESWPASIGYWGSGWVMYGGHFDGQNHTISNLTYTTARNYHGLFGVISNATVENFTVSGTVTNESYTEFGAIAFARDTNPTIRNVHSNLNFENTNKGARIGGILGRSFDGCTVDIERCTYSGTLRSNDNEGNGNYGGMVGFVTTSGNTYTNITNCLFDGTLTNTADSPGNCTFGGIVGYIGGGPHVTITNCLSVGTVTSTKAGKICGAIKSANSSVNNCYYNNDGTAANSIVENAPTVTATSKEAAQLASGEVCYLLNNEAWRQTLGTSGDSYPVLDSSKPNVYKMTVGSAGWASFVPEVSIATLPTGVTAYVGQDNTTYLHLEEVTALPAENAFIVKAAVGNYYYNDANEVITLSKTNDLKFYTTDTESTGNQYCLAKKSDGIGFYQVESGITIPARKAYLQVSSPVKAFYGFDEDDATAIEMVNGQSSMVNEIYNLAGQRIQKTQKGINIINGKKVMVK